MNPAQEHLVTNLLRQKLMAATDALAPVAPTTARRWVLFLAEGEMHELALLFMNYVLRARGHHVLYLGQNLPVAELKVVCDIYEPHALLTVMTAVPERDHIAGFVQRLSEYCPQSLIYLYGPLAQLDFPLPPKTARLALMTDFIALADAPATPAPISRRSRKRPSILPMPCPRATRRRPRLPRRPLPSPCKP